MSGSSVSKDRFVRVLTNGIVVSDELVQERFTKVSKGLAAVQAEIARLNRAGVVPSAGFLTQVQTLKQQLATAMQQPGNQAKCDALKPLKSAFRTIAQQSAQRVDVILADVDLMRQQAVAAQSAINNAQAGIQQIANPAFSATLVAQLATVRNNCPDTAAAMSPAQVRTATQGLTACAADATEIAKRVGPVVQALALHAAKLAEVNTALAALSAITVKITELPQKNAADTTLAALTQRRDGLANAVPATLSLEMRAAAALLADITTATTTGNLRLAWSNALARRDIIRTDAAEYEAIGKKKTSAPLESAAAKLKDELAKLEALSVANPKAATDQLPKVESDYNQLKTQFGKAVWDAKLFQSVEDLIAANPDGPEAQMKKALGTDKRGKDLFEQRLLQVYSNPYLTSNETRLLSPGEMVAINTYTCPDYSQMNAHLLGLTPLPKYDPDDEPESRFLEEPTVDQVEVKNKQCLAALAKLPNYVGAGPTLRGCRKRYPKDDEDFQLNKEYTLKAIWSTSTKKPFEGPWHFTITGSTGKNVAMLSRYPNEEEVVYLPGTKFKVIRLTGTHSDAADIATVRVVLEQV